MGFKFKLFNWDKAGDEPSDNLKQNGFQQGHKPAAGVFNRFWHLVTGAIKELQGIHEGATAHSEDGIAYTATVEGITELYNGLEIVIIPDRISASTSITLDVNGTGAKPVRLPYSMNTSAIGTPTLPTFFGENRPVKLMYCTDDEVMIGGVKIKGVWRTSDKEVVSAGYLSGNVPTTNGGSGMAATNAADLSAKLAQELIVTATTTDRRTYTATIDGITELYNGMQITIIPSATSGANTITLNVNNLGAKPIRQPLSFSTFVATLSSGGDFLRADTPCRLMYHENYVSGGIWLMADKQKTSAQDLYGVVPLASGGTGVDVKSSDDEETIKGKARANLGAAGIFPAPTEYVFESLGSPNNSLRETGYYYIYANVDGYKADFGVVYFMYSVENDGAPHTAIICRTHAGGSDGGGFELRTHIYPQGVMGTIGITNLDSADVWSAQKVTYYVARLGI